MHISGDNTTVGRSFVGGWATTAITDDDIVVVAGGSACEDAGVETLAAPGVCLGERLRVLEGDEQRGQG
jgi:hypothetical protein